MTILINADKILKVHEPFENQLKDRLSAELKRFSEYISEIELHITDENGIKTGSNDIKSVLEAHLKGMKSVVVTEKADTLDQSVNAAIDKIKDSLESAIGKSRDQRQHAGNREPQAD